MAHGHAHHTHGHGAHSHRPGERGRALVWALAANALLLVGMVVAAVRFDSLAVLADAAHQLTDVFGLALAFLAFRLARRPASEAFTWGLSRSEVLGALANAVLLLASGVWILFEATRRFSEPPHVDGFGVVIIAIIGLAVNGFSARSIIRVSGDNLNLRGAALHLLADAAGSAAVLVAGLAAWLAKAFWVDIAASVLIAVLVVWTGWKLLVDTVRVLLNAVPDGVDVGGLVAEMRAHAAVTDVHHVHVWSLDGEQTALSAHVVIDRHTLHDAQAVSEELRHLLHDHHNIEHATLAVECHLCDDVHSTHS